MRAMAAEEARNGAGSLGWGTEERPEAEADVSVGVGVGKREEDGRR